MSGQLQAESNEKAMFKAVDDVRASFEHRIALMGQSDGVLIVKAPGESCLSVGVNRTNTSLW